jgi:plastocyanin
MRRATAFSLCMCLAVSGGLAVAGCGDSSSSSSSSSSKKKKKKTSTTSNTGGPGVVLQNISFNPSNVSVKVGDTVTWTNDESVQHDVTADDGSFKSGPSGGMKQGDKFEHSFNKAGAYAYKCTIHPNMTGKVVVTQ